MKRDDWCVCVGMFLADVSYKSEKTEKTDLFKILLDTNKYKQRKINLERFSFAHIVYPNTSVRIFAYDLH